MTMQPYIFEFFEIYFCDYFFNEKYTKTGKYKMFRVTNKHRYKLRIIPKLNIYSPRTYGKCICFIK